MSANEDCKGEFGRWLAAKRQALNGATQRDAAARAGFSRVQWARWESGANLPRRESIPAVARAVGAAEDETYRRAGYLPLAATSRVTIAGIDETGRTTRIRDLDDATAAEILAKINRMEDLLERLLGERPNGETS
jgi:transcriptional regulator with XRE-family HTH domain